MAVKLFIIGLPGSGKSEIARSIDTYIKGKSWPGTDRNWCITRFNDYPILDEMSKDEEEGKFFERLEFRGFNVLHIVAFDVALQRLEPRIENYIPSAKVEEIIIIEFARNDYWRAFKQFHETFLQDAYFIHLNSKVEVCKQRVYDRAVDPKNPDDDFPVSNYIFEKYYYGDDVQALASILHDVFGVDTERVLMLNNNDSLDVALQEIEPFIDKIIKSEFARLSAIESQKDYSKTSSINELEELRNSGEITDLRTKLVGAFPSS